jgi:RNA polymerase II subunit A small phosphatase-like protein
MEVPSKKLLILDIDETLIFATEAEIGRTADFEIEGYYVYKRPYLSEFLAFCFDTFDVGFWTTATQRYGDEIVGEICPKGNLPVLLWTRSKCTWSYDEELQERILVKKLEKLRRKGFRSESIIAVDDKQAVWRFSYGNLVNVRPFEGDPADNELLLLIEYLRRLSALTDVRPVEKRNWRSKLV